MRTIKFRTWDKVNKHWIYGCLKGAFFDCSLNADGIPSEEPETFLENLFISDWQQFTGLHDKNGKEIYEGDLIKLFSGKITEVRYVSAHFYLHPTIEEIEEYDDIPEMNYANEVHFEIIGNVYEDPEHL